MTREENSSCKYCKVIVSSELQMVHAYLLQTINENVILYSQSSCFGKISLQFQDIESASYVKLLLYDFHIHQFLLFIYTISFLIFDDHFLLCDIYCNFVPFVYKNALHHFQVLSVNLYFLLMSLNCIYLVGFFTSS